MQTWLVLAACVSLVACGDVLGIKQYTVVDSQPDGGDTSIDSASDVSVDTDFGTLDATDTGSATHDTGSTTHDTQSTDTTVSDSVPADSTVADTSPADTTVPVNVNACGYSNGGVALNCGTGIPCCIDEGFSLACGPSLTTCTANPLTELYCEDSSECGTGYLCCLTFSPNQSPAMTSTCRQAAYCGGIELCRTQGATPCSRTSGSCTAAGSNWNIGLQLSQLGAGLGFCTTPTCGGYQQSCSANSDCCSESCDIGGYYECN